MAGCRENNVGRAQCGPDFEHSCVPLVASALRSSGALNFELYDYFQSRDLGLEFVA